MSIGEDDPGTGDGDGAGHPEGSGEAGASAGGLSIAAVERDTGLSKDTLRVWERRYGFPAPERDAFGERSYPLEQLAKLRLIRRLLDAGHRPGKIIGLDTVELMRLVDAQARALREPGTAAIDREESTQLLDLVRGARHAELRAALAQALMRLGLARFVVDVAAPAMQTVGEAWARGRLEVFEEHLFTEALQTVLRGALNAMPDSREPPRVLLTTFPNEPQAIGLLMVEAMLGLEGCARAPLGPQLPVFEIARAAQVHSADAVALWFAASANPRTALEGLAELRERLPQDAAIWVFGRCRALERRPPPGVRVIAELESIPTEVLRWRANLRRTT